MFSNLFEIPFLTVVYKSGQSKPMAIKIAGTAELQTALNDGKLTHR